jgi:isopentenyl-diphosphate delta-isomerase
MKNSNDDLLLLVDKNDKIIGFETKTRCHKGSGLLHRAFSAFIFNDKGQLLIHQRSKYKPLWPLHWSNSYCSHPRYGETYEQGASRRGKQELGITVKPKYLYKFIYHVPYKKIGSEYELCAVLVGKHTGKVRFNPEEVANFKFIDLADLKKDIKANPDKYTPWFKMELAKLQKDFRKEIGMK